MKTSNRSGFYYFFVPLMVFLSRFVIVEPLFMGWNKKLLGVWAFHFSLIHLLLLIILLSLLFIFINFDTSKYFGILFYGMMAGYASSLFSLLIFWTLNPNIVISPPVFKIIESNPFETVVLFLVGSFFLNGWLCGLLTGIAVILYLKTIRS